jgi:hypothetical protein
MLVRWKVKSWKSRQRWNAFTTRKVGLGAEFPIAENTGVEYACQSLTTRLKLYLRCGANKVLIKIFAITPGAELGDTRFLDCQGCQIASDCSVY